MPSTPSDERTTPQDFFDRLSECFGFFSCDAAATRENAKCSKFWNIEQNALTQNWYPFFSIFCNPPYSRGQLMQWIKKAEEAKAHHSGVVMLLPGDTSTAAFHYAERVGDLYFLRGRLKFNGMEASAKFGTVLLLVNATPTEIERLIKCFPGFLHLHPDSSYYK